MSLIDSSGLDQLEQWAVKSPMGDIVEIGVFKGGSAWRLYKVCNDQGRKLHLFDTFDGIPFVDDVDVYVNKGDFSGDYNEVSELFTVANIYKGIFPDTLPDDLGNIAFVHVDCDISKTHRDVISLLPDRMVKGGILYFDDYGNMPGNRNAVDELLEGVVVIKQRAIWRKGD